MLVLLKLYLVPAFVGLAIFVAVAALLRVLVPQMDGFRVIIALLVGAGCGLMAYLQMRRDESRGHRSWY